MRIMYKLVFGFLLISVLVWLVGYISVTTNRDIKYASYQVQQSSLIEMDCSINMALAIEDCQSKVGKLMLNLLMDQKGIHPEVLKREREKLRQDIIRSLEVFRLNDLAGKSATEFGLRGARKWKSKNIVERETKELEERQIAIDIEFTQYRYMVNRFIAIIDSFPGVKGDQSKKIVNKASKFFEEELEIHYKENLIPLVTDFKNHSYKEMVEGMEEIDSELSSANLISIISTIASFLIAVIIGIFITNSISKPIVKLRDAAVRIGRGNFDTPIEIKSRGEIKELAKSFLKMSNELQSAHQELEQRVRDRTAELKESNKKLRLEIIERKHIERDLRKSEAQLSNALTVANMGHWEYDVGKDIFTFTDNFYRMLHTTAEQEGGYTMSSADYAQRFVHPDDLPVVGAEIQAAIETTDPNYHRKLEHRINFADGKTGYITVRFSIVKDENGRTVKTYGVNQDITERKLAEEALRQSEQDYRGLFDGAHDAIIIFKPEDEIVLDVNKRACEIYGYDRSEFIGMSLKEISKNVSKGKKQIQKTVQKGFNHSFESMQHKKDGTKMYVDINASVVNFKGQKAIQSINRNITEKKKAEQELKLFRTLIDKSNDSIMIIDPETNLFLDVNERTCLNLGYSREELLSKTLFDIDPTINESSLQKIDNEIKKAGGLVVEGVHRRKDGSTYPVEVNITSVQLDSVYGVTIARDITDRRKAEEELRDREQKLRTIVEHSNELFFIFDTQLRVSYVSPQSKEILGYSPEEMLVEWTMFLTDNPINEEGLKIVEKTITNGKRQPPFLLEVKRKDGERLIVEIDQSPNIDENGRVVSISGALRDVTEKKRAEEALQMSEEKFRQLYEYIPDAIFVTRIGGKNSGEILDVNRAAESQTGYSREELIGMNILKDLKPEPISKKKLLEFEEDIWANTSVRLTEKKRRKDGSEYWVEVQITTLTYGNEKVFVSINRDITQRLRAERQIQWLARFPKENPAPVIRISKSGKILYANKASSPLLKEWRCQVNERLPKRWRQLVEEIFISGQNQNMEVPAGKQIFSLTFSPMQDENYVNIYGADITDRKQIEEALRESEEKYRTVFENATIGIYRTTPDGRIIVANPALLRMLNYSSFDELSTRNIEQEGYGEGYSRAKFKELIERDNQVKDFEAMWKRRDGSEIFIRENAKAVCDLEGTILYYEGTVEDITEHKLAEKELQLQSAALNSAANAIMITDKKGIIQWVNPALCQLTGYTVKELVGKSPSIFKSGIHDNAFYRKLWTSVLNGEKWEAEVVNKCKNGKLIAVEQRIASVLDEKGEVSHFVAIQQDITERKRIEEALRESEELYRSLAESAPVSIYIVNKNMEVEYVNKFGAAKLQTNPSQIISKHLTQVFPPHIAERQISTMQSIFESGVPYRDVVKIAFPGTFMWADTQLIPLRSPESKIYAVLGISHDITELKKTGDALKQYTARLEALQEIYRGILGSKSSEEIANATLSQLKKIVSKFQRSTVVLFDLNSNEATILARNVLWDSKVTKREHIPLSDFQHVYDLADKPYVLARDLKKQKSKAPVESQLLKEGVRSYFSLPLKINGRLFGSFNIGADTPDAFSEQEIEIACEVGEQLAVAINQAQLKEEIQQHASKLQTSLQEKEMLLKEIHHRVKNNMQVISSLLNLQSGKIQDKSYLELFRDSENRIKSMGLIHEKLYQSESLSRINFADYVAELTNNLFSTYNSRNVKLTLEVDEIYLGVDTAIPCGLIINELVSNAFKYAFPKNKGGEISVKLHRGEDIKGNNGDLAISEYQYVLIVRDNGIGISDEVDLRRIKSLGLKLVHSLVQQLKGTVDYYNNHGAEFKIQFKEIDKSSIKRRKSEHA